jgi:ABC-type Na+ efflux pump permease subunit
VQPSIWKIGFFIIVGFLCIRATFIDIFASHEINAQSIFSLIIFIIIAAVLWFDFKSCAMEVEKFLCATLDVHEPKA